MSYLHNDSLFCYLMFRVRQEACFQLGCEMACCRKTQHPGFILILWSRYNRRKEEDVYTLQYTCICRLLSWNMGSLYQAWEVISKIKSHWFKKGMADPQHLLYQAQDAKWSRFGWFFKFFVSVVCWWWFGAFYFLF